MLDPPSPTDTDSLVGIQEAHASYNARQTKRAPAEADGPYRHKTKEKEEEQSGG